MAENTAISWATHTFNPWIGCSKVSPACDGCYAEALMDKRYGKVQWGPHGERVRTAPANWKQPLKWNRQAETDGTRPFVFCASLADVFDNQVPAEWRRDLFDLIRATPNLVWLLLTKRPQNIVKMVKAIGFMPSNIAFGTSVEDRQRVETNLPHMVVAAGLRPLFLFASCEPLIGDLGDLSPWMTGDPYPQRLAEGERYEASGIKIGADGWPKLPAIGWWITGGETDQGGHKARPTHPDWFRSIRDQSLSHGLAYHHKQNGEWAPQLGAVDLPDNPEISRYQWAEWDGEERQYWDRPMWCDDLDPDHSMIRAGKKLSGRLLDGVTHDAFPEVNHG